MVTRPTTSAAQVSACSRSADREKPRSWCAMCAITYATIAALPEAKINVIARWASLFTCLHLLPLSTCPKMVSMVWIGLLRFPAAPGATRAIIGMTPDLGMSGKSRQAVGLPGGSGVK
jgi:hypothetical protein